jgi:hypothetical protein
MSFLTPLFLLGGLAIAAPIIYHLVRQATREKFSFSSLMFLLPSPPRLAKRHRLEHLLLLLLRCAALLLLAFGFARPFLRQAPVDDPTAAQPKRIVVLVDTSASMRRDGLWDAARTRVEEVLRRAGPADHVAVYPFDRQATALMSFEDWNRAAPGERVGLAVGRLGTISPSWSGTHLGNALVTAAEALGESEDGKTAPGPRQIVLVSDLQAGSRLDALQAYEWPKGVELIVEPVKARNLTNAGVQLVADGPDSTRAVDAPVRVRVTNAAESKREQFKLGWTVPTVASPTGTTPANTWIGAPIDAYVPPGQSRVFSLPVPKGAGATPVQQLSLEGDDERFDNTVHFIPPAQQRATVLWIGSDVAEDGRQPLFFLRRAFVETPRVAVQVVASAPAAALLPTDVNAATLMFVTDPVPADKAAALRTAVEAGRTLVVAPKSAAAAPTLAAVLGLPEVSLTDAQPSTYAMFAEIDFQHPLFAPFADPRFSDFTKIRYWKYRKLATSIPGARVIAKFDSGDPALVEVPVGQGRVYFLASGWQPDDSQLAVSSKFVPLLWSLLEQSGGVASFATQYAIGERVALPAGSAATAVRTPAGTSEPLTAGAKEFAPPVAPGVYELSGGLRPQRFAVNLDANESRTAPLTSDELEQMGVPVARPKTEATAAVDNKTMLQGIEAESRQKLWRWFIVATLALLLAETALAGWTARRSTLQTEEVAS